MGPTFFCYKNSFSLFSLIPLYLSCMQQSQPAAAPSLILPHSLPPLNIVGLPPNRKRRPSMDSPRLPLSMEPIFEQSHVWQPLAWAISSSFAIIEVRPPFHLLVCAREDHYSSPFQHDKIPCFC